MAEDGACATNQSLGNGCGGSGGNCPRENHAFLVPHQQETVDEFVCHFYPRLGAGLSCCVLLYRRREAAARLVSAATSCLGHERDASLLLRADGRPYFVSDHHPYRCSSNLAQR